MKTKSVEVTVDVDVDDVLMELDDQDVIDEVNNRDIGALATEFMPENKALKVLSILSDGCTDGNSFNDEQKLKDMLTKLRDPNFYY